MLDALSSLAPDRLLDDARLGAQRASDYRWLRSALARGVVTDRYARLDDGTPALGVTLAFAASDERLRGGNWPREFDEREACYVEGVGACRAAGAAPLSWPDSMGKSLAYGLASVHRDAARLSYLLDHQALRLVWRRQDRLGRDARDALLSHLPADERRQLQSQGELGVLLLALKVPASRADHVLTTVSGTWLDQTLDSYRKILPPTAVATR